MEWVCKNSNDSSEHHTDRPDSSTKILEKSTKFPAGHGRKTKQKLMPTHISLPSTSQISQETLEIMEIHRV